MAKIENTSNGPRVLHSLPKDGRPAVPYTITAATTAEDGRNTIIKGTGEVPDDVLDELLDKDPFTRGLFASDGGLSRAAAPAKAAAKVDEDTKNKAKT